MKRLILFFSLGLLIFSCQKSEGPESCGVENPTQNLPWLKEIVKDLESSSLSEYHYVVEARYEGNTVFLIQNCCPFCNSIVPVYNCKGEDLGYLSDQNGIQPSKISFVRIVWKPANSSCNFQS